MNNGGHDGGVFFWMVLAAVSTLMTGIYCVVHTLSLAQNTLLLCKIVRGTFWNASPMPSKACQIVVGLQCLLGLFGQMEFARTFVRFDHACMTARLRWLIASLCGAAWCIHSILQLYSTRQPLRVVVSYNFNHQIHSLVLHGTCLYEASDTLHIFTLSL